MHPSGENWNTSKKHKNCCKPAELSTEYKATETIAATNNHKTNPTKEKKRKEQLFLILATQLRSVGYNQEGSWTCIPLFLYTRLVPYL
jgi:hypothetical protein